MIKIDIMRWLPLIVAGTAGFFALIQIRLNNITNARIKWLDTLKSYLSDFIAESTMLSIKKGVQKHIDTMRNRGVTSKESEAFDSLVEKELLDQLKTIQVKYDLIRLNLNLREDLHIALEKLLDFYMDMVNQIPLKDGQEYRKLSQDMDECYKKIVKMVRLIIKLEWEKTKRMRWSYQIYVKYGDGKYIKREALSI